MIAPEVLSDLIAKEASIYRLVLGYMGNSPIVDTIKLNVDWRLEGDRLVYKDYPTAGVRLDELFETREDALFDEKYGDIPSTDSLSLPRWESIDHFKTVFYAKGKGLYRLDVYKDPDGSYASIFAYGSPGEYIFNCNNVSKEGYFQVCEICRRLFVGEDVDEVLR